MSSLPDLLAPAGAGVTHGAAALWAATGLQRLRSEPRPVTVQEQAGFHICIAADVGAAGRQAAQRLVDQYALWREGTDGSGATAFTRRHFTVAVGGGNTVKNLYHALLAFHFGDIDWLGHLRLFVIEETWGGSRRESPQDSLVRDLIGPLARKLVRARGAATMRESLGLAAGASRDDIASRLADVLIHPIDAADPAARSGRGDNTAALAAARRAARDYQQLLQQLLGPSMAFHVLVSGVGKDGGIGAFEPYSPLLECEGPAVRALERADGAVSVVVNRAVLTGARCVVLLIAGSHKLRALGRFEMDDTDDFERTVKETPIRMFRETPEIARKVYVFADDRALMFEEGVFRFRAGGETVEVKSEERAGDEPNGIHILLVHGFMGLFSFINLLIRLPRAWQVSALRRSRYAKSLPSEEVFPHHALALRRMVLSNWRAGRPAPVCCHSMAGLISDRLLLSIPGEYDGELPAFESLRAEDKKLVEALRAGGVINIATWAPSDQLHFMHNLQRKKRGGACGSGDVSAVEDPYQRTEDGSLALNDDVMSRLHRIPRVFGRLIAFPGTELLVNTLNRAVRLLAGRINLQKMVKQHEAPYGMRLLSSRVLQKVSFYGVLKEVDAASHDPRKYQEDHLKALDVILHYDIPHLCIVHRHDLLVSAQRHTREHDFLLAARLEKEGVASEDALDVPASLVRLGDGEDPPGELIDPHFLVLSTTHGGVGHARTVTAAITAFVQDNVARAIAQKRVRPLASVTERRVCRC